MVSFLPAQGYENWGSGSVGFGIADVVRAPIWH